MAGHVRPRRHAAHAPQRPDRPAAAATRSRRPPVPGPATERPLFPIPERLADVQPVEPIRGPDEGRLWNEFVARYHYLGYSTRRANALLRPDCRRRTSCRPRLRRRSLEDRAAACRMGCRDPSPQPAAGGQQRQIPDLALGSDQKPRVSSLSSSDDCPTTGRAATRCVRS